MENQRIYELSRDLSDLNVLDKEGNHVDLLDTLQKYDELKRLEAQNKTVKYKTPRASSLSGIFTEVNIGRYFMQCISIIFILVAVATIGTVFLQLGARECIALCVFITGSIVLTLPIIQIYKNRWSKNNMLALSLVGLGLGMLLINNILVCAVWEIVNIKVLAFVCMLFIPILSMVISIWLKSNIINVVTQVAALVSWCVLYQDITSREIVTIIFVLYTVSSLIYVFVCDWANDLTVGLNSFGVVYYICIFLNLLYPDNNCPLLNYVIFTTLVALVVHLVYQANYKYGVHLSLPVSIGLMTLSVKLCSNQYALQYAIVLVALLVLELYVRNRIFSWKYAYCSIIGCTCIIAGHALNAQRLTLGNVGLAILLIVWILLYNKSYELITSRWQYSIIMCLVLVGSISTTLSGELYFASTVVCVTFLLLQIRTVYIKPILLQSSDFYNTRNLSRAIILFTMLWVPQKWLVLEILTQVLLVAESVWGVILCVSIDKEESNSKVQRVYSVVWLNIVSVCLVNLFGVEVSSPIMSIVLLGLSTAVAVLGQYKHAKEIRLLGLVLAVVSVLKLAVIDTADQGSVTKVLILLVAGILCFIISLVYRKKGE